MPSSPLDGKHDRTTSGVKCHHRIWTSHSVERRRAWNAITSFRQYARSTSSGMACHHGPWTAHTIERRPAWHAIITFGQHTRSNYVRRDMPSSPLGSTNGRTTSGVACQHHLWVTHGRTTTGVACQHRLWAAHKVERRRVWHDITTLRRHTRSNVFGRGMPSLPLGSTYDRMTSGVA